MKRLGILVCGQVRDALLPRFGAYPAMFERLFAEFQAQVELINYAVDADEWPASLNACDAYLITGSRRSVYEDEPWIRHLEEYVRQLHAARRPTVGICFGHQMLGRALGGETSLAPQGWGLGRHCMDVIEPQTWMDPAVPGYALFVSHQDQVVTLPPGARRLAANSHCPNAMFVLDDIMLGIQAHPEFDADYARELALSRADVIGQQQLASAMSTFDQPIDDALIARWIVTFLSRAR